ncbi:MAG TPA: amidohydrolase family protein [Chitinophagaceae bacterium]|nr:amidohydrolase family protein [Chitinophagaceae bacterium]
MILRNLSIHGTEGKKTIYIRHGRITSVTEVNDPVYKQNDETLIDFDDAIAFPGFINSHDHLDFNLFPQLRNGTYKNYRDWGHDIHQQNKNVIDEVLKIPQDLRIRWGLYKNLLNGVTTVVNHGKKIPVPTDLINVLQPASLHSPAFEKNWKWKLNSPLYKSPIAMHIGEGTDTIAKREIDEVIRWKFRRKKIVAVHGVAMSEEQADSFYGLVWCPASNYFLLDQTADIEKLKNRTNIVFGTDSTLTASWNLWEHIRKAKESGINERELLSMLTSNPARLWGLNETGEIVEGKNADITVLRKRESFYDLIPDDILLVLNKGKVKLFDETMAVQMEDFIKNDFSLVIINSRVKYIKGDLSKLVQRIKEYYSKFEFCLSET